MSERLILLKNVERLGIAYRDRYLNSQLSQVWNWDSDKLNSDWWEALKFFFSRSFMRGRKDKLSNEYYSFTIDRLKNDILKTENHDDAYLALQQHSADFGSHIVSEFKARHQLGKHNGSRHERFQEEIADRHPIIRLLTSPKHVEVAWEIGQPYSMKISLRNDDDVMMVLDTLKFICEDGHQNIYSYIIDVVREKGAQVAYNELTALHAVKDKIATLVIRDIGLMNSGLIQADFEFAFPIDTWVRKLAEKIGFAVKNDAQMKIKQSLIERCRVESIDPLLLAAGLWHLGSHSLDILLDDYLGRYELPKRV